MKKLLLLALLLCALAGCYKKAEFKPFSTPESGRFTVLVPFPMPHQSVTTHWAAGDVVLHSYAIERDEVTYVVNYFDIPEEVSRHIRKSPQWDSPFPGREELVKSQQWTVKEKAGFSAQGPGKSRVPGERLKVTSASGKQAVQVALLMHGNRMYQLMVSYPVNPSYLQQLYADRFFSSFQIL